MALSGTVADKDIVVEMTLTFDPWFSTTSPWKGPDLPRGLGDIRYELRAKEWPKCLVY